MEIARRNSACRELGVQRGPAYSEPTAVAARPLRRLLRVLWPGPAREFYLNIPAAHRRGRDCRRRAIHPGTILAEKRSLRECVASQSLMAVAQQSARGDKAAARNAMQDVGVRSSPSHPADEDHERSLKFCALRSVPCHHQCCRGRRGRECFVATDPRFQLARPISLGQQRIRVRNGDVYVEKYRPVLGTFEYRSWRPHGTVSIWASATARCSASPEAPRRGPVGSHSTACSRRWVGLLCVGERALDYGRRHDRDAPNEDNSYTS